MNIEWIGYLAAMLTSIAFVPQVLKTYRSKSAKDLSIGMFSIFTLGLCCWLIYGLSIQAYPIILANSFTLVLAVILLFLKFRYNHQ